MTSRRGGALGFAVAFLCLVTAAACREDGRPPAELLDGSVASPPSVELAGIGATAVATKVGVVAAADLAEGSAGSGCLARFGHGARPAYVVTRVGVDGASVTFRARSGASLYACDSSRRSQEHVDRWCATAYGRLEGGRLTDPRLDLVCTGAGGEPVAFAWIEPAEDAAFVAVEHGEFVEVYEVAADLPVRVTTTRIDSAASTASFEVSEHDRRGSLLREYALVARVAG